MLQTHDHTITDLRHRLLNIIHDADDYLNFLATIAHGGDLEPWVRQHLTDVRRLRADIDRLVTTTGRFTSPDARQRVRNVIESYLAMQLESPEAAESLLADKYLENA